MNIEKLFTKETTIKVSVVTLDGKKMTKAIFNQLHHKKPFDKLYNLLDGVKFLGYVNDKERFVLFKANEKIYANKLNDFLALQNIDISRDTISDLYRVYPSEEVKKLYDSRTDNHSSSENYSVLQISQVLSVSGQIELAEKAEFLKILVNEIITRQIFL